MSRAGYIGAPAAAPAQLGIGLDPYPERKESALGWADLAAARAVGFLRQRRRQGTGALRRVVARVASHEPGLMQAGSATIASELTALSIALGHEGLTDALAGRAFALVRESARRTLGMRHHDVQIMGGWAMLRGMLAEMQTGEGKTVTATLPACVAALAGTPVHVVTVNDYLATRDAESLRPLYTALGLSVGTITEEMDPDARRAAYACNVTYCTNKQIVFDYLRDRQVMGRRTGKLSLRLEGLREAAAQRGRVLLRGLCFAIVDEADSVLVDEARTPLVLSRSSDGDERHRAYAQAVRLAGRLDTGADYVVRRTA